MIYECLDPGTRREKKVTIVYQYEKAWECCESCRERHKREERRQSEDPPERPGPWSPWTLTQLSKADNTRWRPFYYERTTHCICVPQLNDYMATYFGEGEHMVPVDRRGPPAYRVFVVIIAETTGRISLPAFFKANAQFVQSDSQFSYDIPRNGWGKQTEEKRKRKLWVSFFRMLIKFCCDGFMRELLPCPLGTGKIKDLLLDEEMNIRLHPAPEYLSSFPALDPDLRKTLYELWESVSVGSIYLLLLPLHDDAKGIKEDSDHCELNHPFWYKHPHRSHICSVRHFDFIRQKYKNDYSFIVEPFLYVLPEGYNLNAIGVNEQELHAAGGADVYVQLVSLNDDEFYSAHGFYNKLIDEDFTVPVAGTEVIMTGANDGADSVHHDEDKDSDDENITLDGMLLDSEEEDLLKKDMAIPLEVLLKSVRGRTEGSSEYP